MKIKKLFGRISGTKLYYRMFLVYILGGALPMILIGLYLVHGISETLIEQVRQEEMTELVMIRSQAEELFTTVSTVTKYFYFDSRLGVFQNALIQLTLPDSQRIQISSVYAVFMPLSEQAFVNLI